MNFQEWFQCMKGKCYLFILCSAILVFIVSFASESIIIVKAKKGTAADTVYTYTEPDAALDEVDQQKQSASTPSAIADHPADQ